MEGPPFQFESIVQLISNPPLREGLEFLLHDHAPNVTRAVFITRATVDDREVLYLEESRHNNYSNTETTRRVLFDVSGQLIHLSFCTRPDRDTEAIEVVVGDPNRSSDRQSDEQVIASYKLLQDLSQYLQNSPLPQNIEAVEER